MLSLVLVRWIIVFNGGGGGDVWRKGKELLPMTMESGAVRMKAVHGLIPLISNASNATKHTVEVWGLTGSFMVDRFMIYDLTSMMLQL
mmetsp:Transcript_35353/g.42203  ORF Transcript_35353/g.42203 Transcript_35353/m.42203 type:complete len:88 (-) Transcript_35353:8-271(-)